MAAEDLEYEQERNRAFLAILDEARFVLTGVADKHSDASADELFDILGEVTRTTLALAEIACMPWDYRHNSAWGMVRRELYLARGREKCWEKLGSFPLSLGIRMRHD